MERIGICRLCALDKDIFLKIFDEEGYKLGVSHKITKYLQIEINEKDALPKYLCWDCYHKLEQCSNFVNNSQHMQMQLHKMFPVFEQHDPMKEENLYSHENIYHQSHSDIMGYNLQTEKELPGYVCNGLSTPNEYYERAPCLYDERKDESVHEQTDCLYEGKIATDCLYETPADKMSTTCKPAECFFPQEEKMNADEFTEQCVRKKVNRRKCGTPVRFGNAVRAKHKLNKRKKAVSTKKKKTDDEKLYDEDFSENESDVFREKYFRDLPWMCTGCEINFESLPELQNHHAVYHAQTPRYMCPLCYKVYMQYPVFVNHIKKHQCVNTEVRCLQCGKVFPNKKSLESHILLHTDKRPYECDSCGKSFKQQSALYNHARCHLPSNVKYGFACDQCDKKFSTRPNLKTHKRIHADVRNYICDLCGRSFVQKGNLSAHMLTHVDNKPFICEICNREFKTLLQLRRHNATHTGKKPYQCDTCGRTFRERGTLKEHYRIHTGAMPYSCEFCGKSFRFKGALTTHRRTHTGEKPYSCEECAHHFTNWPNYSKHMKRRHGLNVSGARVKPISGPVIPTFEDTLQPMPAVNRDYDTEYMQNMYYGLNVPPLSMMNNGEGEMY